jgi:zinc transporter ZupT
MHDLTAFNWTILPAAVFTVAFFYSSVGHVGATLGTYLATRRWNSATSSRVLAFARGKMLLAAAD